MSQKKEKYARSMEKRVGKLEDRVDKMDRIEMTADPREGQAYFEKFDAAQYAKRTFGMFGGEPEQIRIRFPKKLIGAVVDRFGQDVYLSPDTEESFIAMVKAVASPQFYGWLFGLEAGVEILSPQSVRDKFTEYLEKVAEAYR